MGDLSELRGLIVIMSFLGSFVILIALMPAQFYSIGDYRAVTVPEQFESLDVYAFAETDTLRLNETEGEDAGGEYWRVQLKNAGGDPLGNRDLWFYYKKNDSATLTMYVNHYWKEWLIFTFFEKLSFYHKGTDLGLYLDTAIMEDYREEPNNDTATFELVSPRFNFQYYWSVGFNSTSYSDFTDAWRNKDLWVFVAVDFDDVNTSYNVWQLVGMLLFFQLPAMNTVLNALIAIPLWVGIVYLIYVLIIKVIPLIAGG